jgi:tetratricopeptide (TPR) repeat protein
LKGARYGKTEFVGEPLDRPAAGTTARAPDRAESEFARALGLLRAGDPNQAAIEFQLLAQAYPDLVGPHFNLAMAHRKAGRYDEAATAMTAAVERAPNNPQVLTQLGLTQREAGKFTEARAAYERAIAADANYAAAHRNLGVVLDLYLNDPNTALTAFETYKSLSGEDKPVSGWIAELRQRLGKNERPAPQATPPAESEAPATPTEPAASPPSAQLFELTTSRRVANE